MLPAVAAIVIGAGFVIWQTVIAAPALSFGGPGMVHFKDQSVAAGSEPLLCFDAVVWERLCPGSTFVDLVPDNVADRSARTVNLEPHTISTPTQIGRLDPKCRATKIPAGLAPGVWRLTGHSSNTCTVPVIGGVTVTSPLPSTLVSIKAP